MQALGISFYITSASETCADFRCFFLQNNSTSTFQHVFASVEEQAHGKACLLHPFRDTCSPVSCGEVDLMISGSPCNPFSCQSQKRWLSGGVVNHEHFSTTMESIVTMYKRYQPRLGLFEQVAGFLLPIEQGSSTTPYQRPGFHFSSLPDTQGITVKPCLLEWPVGRGRYIDKRQEHMLNRASSTALLSSHRRHWQLMPNIGNQDVCIFLRRFCTAFGNALESVGSAGYFLVKLELDSSAWLTISRPRTAVLHCCTECTLLERVC